MDRGVAAIDDLNPRPVRGRSKAEIRAALLQRRDTLAPTLRIEYSRATLGRICAMDTFQSAGVVMAYCGFGSEIDTTQLLHAALQSGKKLVLPKINLATNSLDIVLVENLDTDLKSGVWGIRQPNADTCTPAALADLDFVLVPGVAFDQDGGRIGYGKGFYDKLLRACHNAGNHPWTVAAAFDFQVIEAIPMESHDVRINAIATETAYYHCGQYQGP
jgi:5-formyltetrahydrofolate cyclo-ligase